MADDPLFSTGHQSDSDPSDEREAFSTGDQELNE